MKTPESMIRETYVEGHDSRKQIFSLTSYLDEFLVPSFRHQSRFVENEV